MARPGTEEMEAALREEELRNVVLEFADINGISRSKQVSSEYFLRSWLDGFSIPIAILACTPKTVPAEGAGITDDLHYADGYLNPDPETFKVVPWRKRTARVLCDFSFEGDPVACDPRHVLRRMPVVNDDGSLEGIVTHDDLNTLLADEQRELAEVIEAESPAY